MAAAAAEVPPGATRVCHRHPTSAWINPTGLRWCCWKCVSRRGPNGMSREDPRFRTFFQSRRTVQILEEYPAKLCDCGVCKENQVAFAGRIIGPDMSDGWMDLSDVRETFFDFCKKCLEMLDGDVLRMYE